MAENKQFTSDIHRIFDNDEEIACADTMGDAEILVDRLNEQNNRIKELEERNKRQYDSLKKISDLMYARDWKTLDSIVEDWEESDKLLKEIHWCFEKEIQSGDME